MSERASGLTLILFPLESYLYEESTARGIGFGVNGTRREGKYVVCYNCE